MKKRNKHILFLISTFFYFLNCQAQVDSSKLLVLRHKIVDSICVCISKTDSNSVNSVEDAQKMLTRCIKGEMFEDYFTVSGYSLSNPISEEKSQEIADSISLEVYNTCPAMKILINRVVSKQH